MSLFRTKRSDYASRQVDGGRAIFMTGSTYDRFNPKVLGLGDVSAPSVPTESLAVMFDLGGFTEFCNQSDPHLAVPDFMGKFLNWLFEEIKNQATHGKHVDGITMWTRLPFFAKFTGDGVLFLWNVEKLELPYILNIASHAWNVTVSYRTNLYPQVSRDLSSTPSVLRVGLSRGRVYSVGNGTDFVGPCINIAARLQKMVPGLTFACSRRGIDASRFPEHSIHRDCTLKKVAIRGIGDDERVYVDRDEFEALSPDDQKAFKTL